MQLINVCSAADIQTVSTMAYSIWHEHYPGIISVAQIDYMVQHFQGEHAITQQLSAGYQYFFIAEKTHIQGYLAVLPNAVTKIVHLSKFYIVRQARGQGLGSRALANIEVMARQQRLQRIRLTVNKQNAGAISMYQKNGFSVVGEEVNAIGEGFVMDDYIMEKLCS